MATGKSVCVMIMSTLGYRLPTAYRVSQLVNCSRLEQIGALKLAIIITKEMPTRKACLEWRETAVYSPRYEDCSSTGNVLLLGA